MKRIRWIPVLSILLLIFPLRLAGQEYKTLIRLNPFTIAGLGHEERYLIESLIRSYLADFGEVTYNDTPLSSGGFTGDSMESLVRNALETMDSLSRPPEYVISGSIYLEQDNRIFTLEITKTSTGVTSSSTSAHQTTGELALKARSLVESILAPEREDKESNIRQEPLNALGIVGTWRGETGVEMIRFYLGGQGTAIFSSGVQMSLSYSIQDNVLLVKQVSPNTERYYYPLPYSIARQLSPLAEPMHWKLSLYEKGSILKGQRFYTGVNYEGERILELLPGLSREVEWVRIH